MKEYYFLKGKDQKGPFTIEQLIDEELTNETFIWTEGMENWQKLKDTPELTQIFKTTKVILPPLPSEIDEKISKTEVSGHLKVITEKTPNSTLEAIKPSKSTLTWLIAWCGFHLFALLMSYSQIEFFNDRGTPETDQFWPFLKIWEERWNYYGGGGYYTVYNGIFYNYDWSEFAFYVGGAILIYLLVRISNKQEASHKQEISKPE